MIYQWVCRVCALEIDVHRSMSEIESPPENDGTDGDYPTCTSGNHDWTRRTVPRNPPMISVVGRYTARNGYSD